METPFVYYDTEHKEFVMEWPNLVQYAGYDYVVRLCGTLGDPNCQCDITQEGQLRIPGFNGHMPDYVTRAPGPREYSRGYWLAELNDMYRRWCGIGYLAQFKQEEQQ